MYVCKHVSGKWQVQDLIIESGTNTRVIFIAPNAPRPELPYTVIEYEGQKIHGFDDEEIDSEESYVYTVEEAVIFTFLRK